MGKVQVLSGDCIQVMQAFPDNTFDSIVTDPPYGLEFMGKSWDSYTSNGYQDWCERWAVECLRVLKPGGHLLAFGGTRTYHRMACGIEDAGFEIRDSLHWVYGSGFPKSMDISKAIDKAAGAEREAIGPSKIHSRGANTAFPKRPGEETVEQSGRITAQDQPVDTAPATEAAKEWSGWGTALKPAHEPIVLARKPLSGKTVAANVLAYGTGGLNIDGTRVPTADRWEATGRRSDAGSSLAGSVDGSLNVSVSSTHEGGRWPANILLTHAEGCQPAGTRLVRSNSPSVPQPKLGVKAEGQGVYQFGTGEGRNGALSAGYADADGMETVEAWNCAAGCPVAELDRDSGTLTSGTGAVKRSTGKGYRPDVFGGESRAVGTPMVEYGDTGGASRFFPCFEYHKDDFLSPRQQCVLYGMLSVCENANNAESRYLRNETEDSAVSNASVYGSPVNEVKPVKSPRNALTANLPLMTTSVTTDVTADDLAKTKQESLNVPLVSYVGNLCVACATVIVQSIAATQHGHSGIPELGLPSTGDFSEHILTRSLVLCAETLEKYDTTSTIQDLTISLGFAVDAISMYITRVSPLETRKFVPWRYQAKAPKKERPTVDNITHVTVKPLELMRWLVRLVTPPDGVVLDPFAGSGTTGEACLEEGFRCVLVEREPGYLRLIRKRLDSRVPTLWD